MVGSLFWGAPHSGGIPSNHGSAPSRSRRQKVHAGGDERKSFALVSQAFFLDTNIFVYSFDSSHPLKQKRAESLIVEAIESDQCAISTQVIQEFLNVALGKFANRMSGSEAMRFLDRILWPLCKIHPNASLYVGAVSVMEETGWTFYDSLIVSAAVAARCPVLLTEDLQSGRVVRGVEIRNPFV